MELEPRWLLNRSLLVAATLIELCNGNIFSLQVLTKNLERGRFTWTIQPGEVKECHKVTEGRCSNGDWRRFFEAAGEIFPFLKSSNFPETVPGVQIFFFRNLGPAHHCPCCCRGLCSPRCRLLQRGRLIEVLSLDKIKVKRTLRWFRMIRGNLQILKTLHKAVKYFSNEYCVRYKVSYKSRYIMNKTTIRPKKSTICLLSDMLCKI